MKQRNTIVGQGRDGKDAKATVFGPNDFDEFEVHFFEARPGGGWQRRHSATYHTDDLDDAVGTAQDMTSGPPADWRDGIDA